MSEPAGGPRVRAVHAQESELLASVHRECFPHYWDVDAFNNFFGIPGTSALLAEAGDPAAIVVWRVQFEQSDILTLAVREPYRGRGLGTVLMRWAMQAARDAGAQRMFLDVEDGNEAALNLYRNIGFTQQGRRKQYYRQKQGGYTDALVMACKLD